MIGQILDRRYRITKVLSSGQFGQTYLAADTHRPGYPQCLVRQLRPPSNNPRTLQIIELLFKKKAESLEKLGKHDRIPQLLAFFEENKEFYLVEEFIPGRPLASEIGHGKPLNEEQTRYLLQEVLEILVFVHGHGIVHRDIRADNIVRRHQDGKLVLIDFGPVKEISYQLMKAQGQSVENGTGRIDSYIPYEQFQGNFSYNTDLYAAGAIAIQALTGFSAPEVGKLLKSTHNSNGKHWPHGVNLTLEFREILDKMVHPDPSQRYQSATEVLADLRKLNAASSGPAPIPLPPPPPPRSPEEVAAGNVPVSRVRTGSKSSPPIAILLSIGAAIALLVIGLILYNRLSSQRVAPLQDSSAALTDREDSEATLDQLDRAVYQAPNDPEAHYQRGNVLYKKGDYEAAIGDYTSTLRLDPERVDAYYNRGLARYELGEDATAVEDFTEVLRRKPTDADAYYQRGLAYHGIGDYAAAIADYTKAIDLKPELANLAYLNRGLSRSAADDKQGAIADYTEALKLDPKNPDTYYSRGRARFFLADYQGAMEDYSEAIALNPEASAYYTNRCGAYLNLSEYEKAIADCTQALELDPKDATASGNRCIAYMNEENYPQAVVDCTEAIQLDPDNAKLYSNRGLARAKAGDLEGAIADYTRAIQAVPSDAVAYNNRGEAYAKQGNFAQAIADYTQAIRLKPDYDSAYYNRGMVRSQLGDKPGAIDDLQKAGTLCLDRGMAGCYNDAQFQIRQLRGEE